MPFRRGSCVSSSSSFFCWFRVLGSGCVCLFFFCVEILDVVELLVDYAMFDELFGGGILYFVSLFLLVWIFFRVFFFGCLLQLLVTGW